MSQIHTNACNELKKNGCLLSMFKGKMFSVQESKTERMRGIKGERDVRERNTS